MQNALVHFSVKDKDLFGISNQYIADCFVLFSEIANFDQQQQIHLKLNRPPTLGGLIEFYRKSQDFSSDDFDFMHSLFTETDCIRALEYRPGDKQAKDFLKKIKQKLSTA